jgi:hypothetical protein
MVSGSMHFRRPLAERRWLFSGTIILSLMAVLFVRHYAYEHPSRANLAWQITQRQAILADAAEIKRDEPDMGTLIEPNAICLTNPTVIDAMPADGQQHIVVIADDPFFAGEVDLAIYDRKK